MNVRVKLFAVARQRIGRESIEVELSPAATIRQLRGAIVEQYSALVDVIPHVRFAVNSEYAGDSVAIPATAEIAIIPPVSGG